MIDTARIIITQDCNRDCIGCCNKGNDLTNQATIIQDLSAIKDYPIVAITGGEPLLYPKKLLALISELRKQNNKLTVYLYTAIYNDVLYDVVGVLDGVHYTLHYPCTTDDIADFEFFQDLIKEYDYQTFRLYIDNRVSNTISVQPNLWHRIEIKAWMKKCLLPINENLFILSEDK